MRSSWIGLTVLVLFAVGCNGTVSETVDDVAANVVGPSLDDLTGTFVGTIRNASFSREFHVSMTQLSSGAVVGSWSLPSDVFDDGTLSGMVSASGFDGSMSINEHCTGQPATLAGNRDKNALVWTSPGFTGSCSSLFPGGAFTITLHPE